MAKHKLRTSETGMDRLIHEFSMLYGTNPMGAFKEYVTNGIDAIYQGRLTGFDSGLIKILLDPVQTRLIIQDDALGMSREKVESLPVNIGESDKKGKIDLRGEKAVGLLAFGSLGDQMHLVTRQPGNSGYSYLRYEIGNEEIYFDDIKNLKDGDMHVFGGSFSSGTKIILDIKPQMYKAKFKAQQVREAIRDIYWPFLLSGDINFEMGLVGEDLKPIGPPEVDGDEFFAKMIPFTTKHRDGEKQHLLKVNLWLNPETDAGRIPLYSKGVKVYKSITEIEDEDLNGCDLWKSRQVIGFIDNPNLSLTLGRDKLQSLRDSNAYQGFIEQLVMLNDSLWPEVRSRIARIRKTQENKYLSQTVDALKKAFEDPALKPLYGVGGGRDGGPTINWPTDEGDEGEDKDPKRTPRDKKRRWQFGDIQSIEFGLGERQHRSKLDSQHGVPIALINTAHPDYKKIVIEGSDSRAKIEYLLRTITHPLSVWESQKAIKNGRTFESEEQRIAEVTRRTDDLTYNALRKLG